MESVSNYDNWDLDSEEGQSRCFNLTLSSSHLHTYVPHDDAIVDGGYVEEEEEGKEEGRAKGYLYDMQGMYGFVEEEPQASGVADRYASFVGAGQESNCAGQESNYAPFEAEGDSLVSKKTSLSRMSQVSKQQGDEEVRDWTAEWREILAAASPTKLDKLAKLVRLKALAIEFESAALGIVKTIVEERNAFVKTIKPILAGGVAGGVKYLHRNIFLKFTLDQMGLYSGDEFSAKAAGRELSGLGAFLNYIVSKDTADDCTLNTALFCIVDYAGWRVIASSLLPIGSSTLLYGSNNGGVTVHAKAPAAQAMEHAAAFLNLKGHDCQGTKIFGPADIEVHQGSDGRLYILDTARVAMPEHPPRYFQALLIDCDSKITPVDLPVIGYEESLTSFIDPPHNVDKFLLGQVISSKQATVGNRLVSLMLGAPAFGECLVLPTGIKGRYLYNLMRREFYQKWERPLSSDAFSGFGRDGYKEHNLEIVVASMALKSVFVPRVVEYLDFLAQQPGASSGLLSGEEVTRIMHERGVNMRLLGLVWARSQNAMVKSTLMAEMISRAAKQLFRGAMRAAETHKQLRAVVINTLNLLLGESKSSSTFYETAMQLQLRSKYGSYGEVFEAGQDYRHSFEASVLFQRLIFVLGVSFPDVDTEDKDALLARFSQPHPFSLEMRFEIGQRVKSLVTDLDLREFASTAPMCSPSDLERFRRSLAAGPSSVVESGELAFLQRVASIQLSRLILGDYKTKEKSGVSAKVLQVARARLTRARTMLLDALVSKESLPLDLISATCHILVDVSLAMGTVVPAQAVEPLEALIRVWPDQTAHTSLLFFAFEKLTRAYHRLQLYSSADRTAARLKRLQICFSKKDVDGKCAFDHKIALTRRQCKALFGGDELLSFCYTGDMFGFVESELDPSLELLLLPFERNLLPTFVCQRVAPPSIGLDPLPEGDKELVGFPPENPFVAFELEYTGPRDDFPLECTVRLVDSSKHVFGQGGELSAHVSQIQEEPTFRVSFEEADLSPTPSTLLEVRLVEKRARPKQKRCDRDAPGWNETPVKFCLTCWPDDDDRERNPVCESCSEFCHVGHTISEKTEQGHCKCEIVTPVDARCEKFGANSTCATCWPDEEKRKDNPICPGCRAQCHVDHDVRTDEKVDGPFCKCNDRDDSNTNNNNNNNNDEDGDSNKEDGNVEPNEEGADEDLENLLARLKRGESSPRPKCLLVDGKSDEPCKLAEKPIDLEPDLKDLVRYFHAPLVPLDVVPEVDTCAISMCATQPVVTRISLGGRVQDWAISASRAIVVDHQARLSEILTNNTFPSAAQTRPIRTAGGSFRSISVGSTTAGPFFVALNSKGMTYTWGSGGNGQLGHGDKRDYDAPKVLQALTSISGGITGVCCGAGYSLAYAGDNLWFWGAFKCNMAPFPVILQTPPGVAIAKVAANPSGVPSVCLVLFNDHSVRILEEDKASSSKPPKLVLVEELKDVQVIDIAAADEYCLFLAHDGRVYECGTRSTQPRFLLSAHGNLEFDEELFSTVANPTAADDDLKVPMTPSLDMHSSNSTQLRLEVFQDIARIWAAGKETLLLSRSGELFHSVTGGPTRVLPGHFIDVHSVTSTSIVAVRAPSSSVPVVKPTWDVAPLPPVTERFSLRRLPNIADEGGEEFGLKPRDFSVHLLEETIRCEWTRPSWSTYFEVSVTVLILGETDNNYARNKRSDFKGVVDSVPFNVPEREDSRWATDKTERRVRLDLCEKYECCTSTATGYMGVPQALTRCFTCSLDDICAACMRLCHAHHDVGSAKVVKGFCACGTRSKVGCPRRLSIVYLRPDPRKNVVLDSFCVRPILVEDLPREEIVVAPFRRVLISKVDQLLHVHLRLRTFGYKSDRPRLELIPEGGVEAVAQSDEVDDEKAASLNVSHVTPGVYKLKLSKENHRTLEFGLVEFVAAPAGSAEDEAYHPMDEDTLFLLRHGTWLANRNLKAKYAPTCEILSVIIDGASLNAIVVVEVDLGGILPENIDAPRLVAARRSQLPYCKSQDAALLFKFDIPEKVLGTLKHTVRFSALCLRDNPEEGVVLHVTTDLERRTQIYCPIVSVDISERLREAMLNAGPSAAAAGIVPEWPCGPVRPSNPVIGQCFFDTTLRTPIWFDGKQWIGPSCNPK